VVRDLSMLLVLSSISLRKNGIIVFNSRSGVGTGSKERILAIILEKLEEKKNRYHKSAYYKIQNEVNFV